MRRMFLFPNALNQITVCVMISFDTQIEVAVVIKNRDLQHIIKQIRQRHDTEYQHIQKQDRLIVYGPILNYS